MAILRSFVGKTPQVGEGVFLADNAVLVGDVIVGARTSIWFGAVLRGDVYYIRVGEGTPPPQTTAPRRAQSASSTPRSWPGSSPPPTITWSCPASTSFDFDSRRSAAIKFVGLSTVS